MKKTKQKFKWNEVTTLSKYVALALFVALPFIGFALGMKYQLHLDAFMREGFCVVDDAYSK